MLADHRQRISHAQAMGNLLAVSNDITDELNDAIAFLIQNYGEAEAWRFKCLYAECQREAYFPEVIKRQVQRVTVQPQIGGMKQSNGSFILVLAILFFIGVLVALG